MRAAFLIGILTALGALTKGGAISERPSSPGATQNSLAGFVALLVPLPGVVAVVTLLFAAGLAELQDTALAHESSGATTFSTVTDSQTSSGRVQLRRRQAATRQAGRGRAWVAYTGRQKP